MISPKQQKILAFAYSDYDAIICDGAVRSGKTSIITWAFVKWAMDNFNGQRFGVCGKTVDSAKKNIIVPFLSMSLAKESYTLEWRSADKALTVRRGTVMNIFEVFGGKDESSFSLIQGRTLAGVMLDEVVLMPRSFVEQALARCSVDGARAWFSCNSESPQHWFYLEWIKKHRERNALYLHFTMRDNPGLSERTIARYEAMYSGVFYRRYILGEWCVAEGLVYDLPEANIVPCAPDAVGTAAYYISCDYGTLNPFAAILWRVDDVCAVAVAEYYYSGRDTNRQRTDEDYCDAVEELAAEYDIASVIVDPSAASFIAALRRRGRFTVRKAKNDVLDGIRQTAVFLKSGRIRICKDCENTIREFGLYRWDEKATADTVIKENDHAMDAVRYMAYTALRNLYRDPLQPREGLHSLL